MQANPVMITLLGTDIDPCEFVFDQPGHCVLGRSNDCDVPFPPSSKHATISRLQCALEVDPPFVFLRDLGSRNGTYLNGRLIGRATHKSSSESDIVEIEEGAAHEVHDGDEIRIGNATIRVGIALLEDSQRTVQYSWAVPSFG